MKVGEFAKNKKDIYGYRGYSRGDLIVEIKKAEAQINKMKRCNNCHYYLRQPNSTCDDCDGLDNWISG